MPSSEREAADRSVDGAPGWNVAHGILRLQGPPGLQDYLQTRPTEGWPARWKFAAVTVTVTSETREQLSELPRLIVLRMEKLLTRLRQWPNVSGVKNLRGDLSGKCRLRTGDYRLQFQVREKKKTIHEKQRVKGKEVIVERESTDYSVVVEKIGHRDGFYEEY